MKISQRLTGLGLALLLTSPAYAERPKTSPMKMFSEMQQLIVSLSNRIKPAVVHVDVVTRRGEERHHVMGSGLILSSDGTIVTNHHVIDHAEKIEVILDDKTRYDATVMRQDRQTDLALLKIKVSHPLPFAKLGDSDKVQVGQWVLAIGNPFGFDRTVSFGIISGKGRFIPDADSEVRLLNDFLQTDAMIDPGNSGGPLVNLDGEVIGINSAGMGRGQGFTIPSKVVKEVLTRNEVEGRLERGWIGVYPQPLTREVALYLGKPGLHAVLVSDVLPNSPAERAGLKSGDLLTRVGDTPVEAETEQDVPRFAQLITHLAPGTKFQATYLRDGQSHQVEVTVGLQPLMEGKELETNFGTVLHEITMNQVLQYRLERTHGVLVTEVRSGSPGDDAGLERGDVILAVDGHPVESMAQLTAAIDKPVREKFLLQVMKGKLRFFAFVDRSPRLRDRKTSESATPSTP